MQPLTAKLTPNSSLVLGKRHKKQQ